MNNDELQVIKDDLATVFDARSYVREHFPMGSSGKYVGHVLANDYNAAVDRITDSVAALVVEVERLREYEWMYKDLSK